MCTFFLNLITINCELQESKLNVDFKEKLNNTINCNANVYI